MSEQRVAAENISTAPADAVVLRRAIDRLETSVIDALYCELSQITKAKSARELSLEYQNKCLRSLIQGVIQRCEPSGYVGQDGQYLKELCSVFES